jgi:UDP-3-O-[3-hydroxymyristoyl] glucosamine N-acyltransferase
MDVALREITAQLGGELIGDGGLRITRIGRLEGAGTETIAFLSNARYLPQLAASAAACVIVAPAQREAAAARGAAIVAPDPYLYYARLTQWWAARDRPAPPAGVHASAVIDPSARIDPSASVGPLCVVGAGASIGAGTRLAPRVTVGDGCSIGARCLLHSGVVIGADGFGFAPHGGRWEKIEQLGAVRIGDDVEIGANTCIDRGALDDTVIGDGVKLDNLIQIGHNVKVGAHTAMAGNAGVAGSATIGAHCTIGGGAVVLGHLTLADHVHVSAASVVMRSIRQPGQYSGVFPIDDNAAWEKNAATLRQLHALRDRVRALEKKLDDEKRQP